MPRNSGKQAIVPSYLERNTERRRWADRLNRLAVELEPSFEKVDRERRCLATIAATDVTAILFMPRSPASISRRCYNEKVWTCDSFSTFTLPIVIGLWKKIIGLKQRPNNFIVMAHPIQFT